LGGDGAGHCKKKRSYEYESNSECLPSYGSLKYHSIVNGKKKER